MPQFEIDAHGLDAELAPNVFEDRAYPTAHIQNTTNRHRIAPDGPDDAVCIAQPPVNAREIAVRTLHQFVWNVIGVQNLCCVFPKHPPEL